MTRFSLILSLSSSLISQQCFATQSNLDNFNYPSHNCGTKVKKPNKPKRLTSNEDIDKYEHDGILISSYVHREAIYNKLIELSYDKEKILQFFY